MDTESSPIDTSCIPMIDWRLWRFQEHEREQLRRFPIGSRVQWVQGMCGKVIGHKESVGWIPAEVKVWWDSGEESDWLTCWELREDG